MSNIQSRAAVGTFGDVGIGAETLGPSSRELNDPLLLLFCGGEGGRFSCGGASADTDALR
jgi:hypothetical protein